MLWRRAILCLFATPAVACASAAPKQVDLAPARAAVQKARAAGAAEKSHESFSRAEGHLKQAEAAANQPGSRERVACLAALAVSEAECSAQLALEVQEADPLPLGQKDAAETDKLVTRLKSAEDEQRRLEERVAVLVRDLELTETEVIRTQARLQGLEPQADSTSVNAETRVLTRRFQERRARTPVFVRSQELLDRAEQMVEEGNYGAATFLALKAQELLKDERRGADDPGDRQAPKRQYAVRVDFANLRREPARTAPLQGRVKKGDLLEASGQRGEWLHVRAGDLTGWIHRDLVE